MKFNFVGLKGLMVKHSPEILTGVGIAGMVSSTILAIRGTPRAIAKIQERIYEENVDDLSFGEKLKTAIPYYIPTITTSLVGAGCIISGLSINLNRNAALAVAASVAEAGVQEYREYRHKIGEIIGEEKSKEIQQEIQADMAEQKARKAPFSDQKIIVTGFGDTLCCDGLTGRFFTCDPVYIKKSVNDFNRELRSEMTKPLNEFYSYLGLPMVDMGNILEVNIDNGYLDVDFRAGVTDEGRPYTILVYDLSTLCARKTVESIYM